MPSLKNNEKRVRVTYVKSVIGYEKRQKETVRALGLRRLGQSIEHPDTPAIRGMASSVRHLVVLEEIAE